MGGNSSRVPTHINWTCQRNIDQPPASEPGSDEDSDSIECAVMNLEKTDWKWPEGRVPYKIDIGLEECPELIAAIQQAIAQFHLQTPIRFAYLPPWQSDDHYVKFMFHETSTSSDVGRKAQPQTVYISLGAKKGNVMHELMHVLGFYHEQSRPDRLVEVSTNIPEEYKHDYLIEGHAIGSYDPDSIMHYPSDEFMEANPKLTSRMGQREGFSPHDLMGLEYLYGEPKCSHDIFGEEYFIQANYECITCWGRDSAYSICEYCKNMHHKDCETIEHSFKDMHEKGIKSVCDCGRNQHQENICTKVTIRERLIEQNMYVCIDCFMSVQDFKTSWNFRKKGICQICVHQCHSGHKVEVLGRFEGICICSEPYRRSNRCKAIIKS